VNKRNLIIQAAVAGLFSAATLSAYATGVGSANGNSAQIATQAVTNTTDIGTGSIQFVETGSIPAGNYYVYVKLNQGATFAAGAGKAIIGGATPATSALLVKSGNTIDPNVTVGNGTVSADATFVAFPITVGSSLAANTETFTFQPVANATIALTAGTGGSVTGALAAAASGSLTATVSIGASASYSTTTPVADEATASTAPIAYFVSGITPGALQSGASGFTKTPYSGQVETDVIDVTGISGATVSASELVEAGSTTNTGASATTGVVTIDLGGFLFADVSTTTTAQTAATGTQPFAADAATTFNIATDYTGATSSAVVTAPAGFFNVIGTAGKVTLGTAANCLTPTATATVSTNGATATFSNIPAFTQDKPLFVCVTGTSTTAWVAGTPSITATLVANTSTTANVTLASTNLYTLGTNGSSVYVREYVPAAATATTGYQSFLRVINTGSVAAKVSFAFIDDAAGVASTSATGTTASAVPAGGAITLTSSQVETLVGTPEAASARPRVLVTAPTSITVQSYLYNGAANVFTEVSGGSNGGAGTGGGSTTSATGQ